MSDPPPTDACTRHAPAVTIVVPAYNAARFIGETLDSLLSQSFDDLELLVVDDASSDDTTEVVRGFSDSRLRLVVNRENLGLPATMNKALDLARGAYLARCDHDDLARPDRLERQMALFAARPDLVVCGSAVECFGLETGVVTPPAEDRLIKAHLLEGTHHIFNPSAMYRLDFVRAHGLRYDPTLFAADDYGFWVAAMAAGAVFANIQEPLMRYRFHGGNASKMHAEWRVNSILRVRDRAIRLFFPDLTVRETRRLGDLFIPSPFAGDDVEAAALIDLVARAIAGQDRSFGQDAVRIADILAHFARQKLPEADPELWPRLTALASPDHGG